MPDETTNLTEIPRSSYEQTRLEVYAALQSLVEICLAGHGDKHLLWSIHKVRHELLTSLSAKAGVAYPELLEWLTDQDRIQLPRGRVEKKR